MKKWVQAAGSLLWTNGNPVSGSAPVTPSPPPVPTNVKMYSIEEVASLLEAGKRIQVSLIKEGCKMCNIPFVGGGVIFINKRPTVEEEYDEIKRQIADQLGKGVDYVVAYAKQERGNTPQYSYYSVIAIRSSDVVDLKKAFKVQKLKAFL